MSLQDISEQTVEQCLEAVTKNGLELQYVKEQTPEICLAAVEQNREAVRYVKKQTEDVCHDINAIKRVDRRRLLDSVHDDALYILEEEGANAWSANVNEFDGIWEKKKELEAMIKRKIEKQGEQNGGR